MSKWRLQTCRRRFLCMSVWRCRPASRQISCICLHLPAAVSLVSGWSGATLLQQPNPEPADLSGCLFSLFFSSLALPCAFSHLSAARSSSCILPAVASLYKCLPPLLPSGPCVTVTFDKSRAALSLRPPFWLMVFTPVIISYRAAVRSGTDTQARPATSHHGPRFFVPFFSFLFSCQKWRTLWHSANGLLNMSLFPHIILSQLGKLKSTALLYHPGLDLFPSFKWTTIKEKHDTSAKNAPQLPPISDEATGSRWCGMGVCGWCKYGRWGGWCHHRATLNRQFSSVQGHE